MSNGAAEITTRRPQLGVCYYPEHWPESEWTDHARQMVEIGLSYVRIGEFAWSRLEPNPGQYEFDWLARAIDVLGQAGLKVVLGTPTATPPKWLVDTMPDMIAIGPDGHKRGFGSRRHYDFSHHGYRVECARIITKLAEKFGEHPAVTVWQTDNEYGCHDTTYSYSNAALTGFRSWLKDKYGTIGNMNEAWGNVFWSMEYRDFSEIDLPNLTVTEANPSHHLAFRRYSSDQVVTFNREQVEILRKLSPGRDIIHNFMGMFTEFDHFDVAEDLDISSWDSYPLGFLERRTDLSDAHKEKYLNQGDPDFTAFHHDLYRGTGNGRWWVMEQQPGTVNWADWNPAPLPGMVRLWTWEAIAHGAEVVSYFRWRQAPFAQEQMHAGLNKPDGTADIAAHEAAQVASELDQLDLTVDTSQADVALILDYPSIWMTQIQPQGKDYDPIALHFAFYCAARKLGLSVDIVASGADLSGYELVMVPNLLQVTEHAAAAFEATNAQIVFGPRTGSKTHDLAIPANLAPGPLAQLLQLRVDCVESLRPGIVHQAGGGSISKWREHLTLLATPDDCYQMPDGHPAYVQFGRISYLAGWPDENLLQDVLVKSAERAGLQVQIMPDGVRVRTMGPHKVYTNYGRTPANIEKIIGSESIVQGEGGCIQSASVVITRIS
ncbi:beta-galactosidase [Pararhizobium sp. IMCC21322]|uniref:beta-galactosidase n=1 Tax=Pararhizobium sp. IMCC21322 TaxID=3067903 RepID=UPI0027416590|nr:beta-galactosidase [Pararhizobium sp. IMCC21322]